MNWELALALCFALGALTFFVLWQRAKAQLEASSLAKGNMEDTFKALASDALKSQSESFLQIATERLDRKTEEARGALQEKTMEFQKLVEPIEKTLTKVQSDLGDFERRRGEQYGQLSESIRNVLSASELVQKEARQITSALRRPEVRGSWGEIQLRRVAELSGMAAHCDFEEQVTVGGDQKYRPDLIVHLPNSRVIVVDSKAVLTAYLEAQEAADPERRKELLRRHAQNLRSRVDELARKAYWEQVTDQTQKSIDLVVLFVPNEAFLQAAVEADPSLIEDALSSKVMVCTATNLVALLKAIAYGWQENQIAQNAQLVIKAAKELYERVFPWLEHLEKVGKSLKSSLKSYDDAVGSLNTRVLPAVRRLKELGIKENRDADDLAKLEISPET